MQSTIMSLHFPSYTVLRCIHSDGTLQILSEEIDKNIETRHCCVYLHHFGFFERQEEVTICYSVVTTEGKKSEIGLPILGWGGGNFTFFYCGVHNIIFR